MTENFNKKGDLNMKKKTIFVLIFLLTSTSALFAQTNQPEGINNQPNYHPQSYLLQNISAEITKISKSVQNFKRSIKKFLEKLLVGRGMTILVNANKNFY